VAANQPRIDYDPVTLGCRGLLIEEQRTNLVANSTGSGAVVGGAPPTGWAVDAPGLTVAVVGKGEFNGLQYVDVRVSGTATATWFSMMAGLVPASSGRVFTASAYVGIAGGSTAGITLKVLRVQAAYPGGTEQSDTPLPLLSPLGLSRRYAVSRTLVNPGIISVAHKIGMGWPVGTSVDITLRIAGVQLEEGGFATSYIPTAGAQVTRAADSAAVALGPWHNAAEGTLFTSAETFGTRAAWAYAQLWSGSTANRVGIVNVSGVSALVDSGGVSQMSYVAPGTSGVSAVRAALAYKSNDCQLAYNGQLGAVDGSVTLPAVTELAVGRSASAETYLNGHVKRLAYWPARLSAAALKGVTA
jgi:hypothetical protein